MRFIAIDVETSNANMASICAIGCALFEDNNIVSEWYSLVNPCDFFDPMNVSIHGISEDNVQDSPKFYEVFSAISDLIAGEIVVSHTSFDRTALLQATNLWSIEPPSCTWLDSARVARRIWSQCSKSGYGLSNVCKIIGYEFEHHNALEDAKAAGHIIVAALQKGDLNLEELEKRAQQPISLSMNGSVKIHREGNPIGPLADEVIVFTGALEISRSEAADLAASVGCDVNGGVTKSTTILVVGDMDVTKLAGHEKSSKHRKAERLIAAGQSLKIIRETDFKRMIKMELFEAK